MHYAAIKDLARSDILPYQADEAGIEYLPDVSAIYDDFLPLKGLLIPYYEPETEDFMVFERGGKRLPFARVRYLEQPKTKPGFKAPKPQRYGQPSKSGCRAYFPITSVFDWIEVIEDTDKPIIITEGEKKALRGCLAGMPTIGLGGVYNFLNEGALLPELDRIPWDKRPVYICFDSDAANNPQIQAAEGRLATELSLKRNASVFLVRLPDGPSGDKMGVDDYIAGYGEDAWIDELEKALPMRRVDSEVIGLNAHVAWIEKDQAVYDLRREEFMDKSSFARGSKYSAISVEVATPKGQPKSISVASTWLTHPHAQRYDDVLFRPDNPSPVVETDTGGTALNLWHGFDAEPGDVSLFLELDDFIFSQIEEEHRDFAMKLMAYKAQNPHVKVPIALMFVGPPGSGKSLWGQCMKRAFGRYGTTVESRQLTSDFTGWLENSLLVMVDEVRPIDIQGPFFERIKNLISEQEQRMNEKFRKSREIDAFCQFIFTANKTEVASFPADDRRFFVINTPPSQKPKEFYDAVRTWRDSHSGPKALMHYLLNYNLRGWTPPIKAPLTAEKYMAYVEGLTPIQRLAEEIRTADENIVIMWMKASVEWAHQTQSLSTNPANLQHAAEILEVLPRAQVRPFYTPEEIKLIFPSIAASLHENRRIGGMVSGEMSRQLRDAGVHYLRNRDDPRGFRWKGRIAQFLVIADQEDWLEPISQNDFDRLMKSYPRLDDYLKYVDKHE